MSSGNNYRKIFFDSRWRSSGDHNSFSIELPNDLDTTRTASVYLASCSFSNTFQSVEAGVNDTLYFLLLSGGAKTACVAQVPQYQYDGASLASILTAVVISAMHTFANVTNSGFTATFDATAGFMTFATHSFDALRFPTDSELRDPSWRALNWDPYASGAAAYSTANPASLNRILYFPKPSQYLNQTVTSNIDLAPYREVYLHCSLTNFRTLKTGTGEKDCLARIPVDVPYGDVVVYRHLGPSDALSASDLHLHSVSFSFRDWAGNLVPIDQPVVVELVFLDSDPYTM